MKIPQYCLIGVLIFFSQVSFAADWISDNVLPSKYDHSLYEINKINIVGNNSFNNEKLQPIIKSKEISKSPLFETLEGFYLESNKNKYTPAPIKLALQKSIKPYIKDFIFFSPSYAKTDSISLFNFYNTNGFHLVDITKRFFRDTVSNSNILEFNINEGERFKIGSIQINGTENLNQKIRNRISSLLLLQQGDYFDEVKFSNSGLAIQKYLKSVGYKFATYNLERVVIDRENFQDNISIIINPGIRLKFGKVEFVHIKFENKKISDKLLRKVINIGEGKYYNEQALETTQKNLFDLGVFNSVKIITKKLDSTSGVIDQNIVIEYRYQRTYELKPGINRTDDNFTNIFGSAEISHQNILGGAQQLKVGVSVIYRDINDLNNSRANTGRKYIVPIGNGGIPQPDEYNLSLNYLEHSLTTIGDARVMFEFKPQVALRRIFNDFNIRRVSLPFNFPIRFKTNLDFSNLNFKFLLESEKTLSFESIYNVDDSMIDDLAFQRLLEANITYQNLFEYGQTRGSFPITTMQLGVSATKDERDNNFYPSDGYLIDFQLEGSSPNWTLSRYLRTLFDYLYFKKLSSRLVLAGKFKAGYIWFYNRENTYVPLDKQFYSGGANSVRGWAARKLRYTSSYDSSLIQTNQVGFLENYVGNTTTMEFTLELRYDLKQPKGVNEFMADLIGSSSLSVFLDGGNSFNWLINDSFKESFSFSKFAYSIGTGYGYKTPIGPLRFDYALPLYGPIAGSQNLEEYQSFANPGLRINDKSWLRTGSFHIALGYSF
ncbi:BamA/TamA family outer membrane protein [Candidatus Kapabacteria bacterium]|nr:BamA/TamA family outer membrane protein [Candidatus Kapabacteria bacterium]